MVRRDTTFEKWAILGPGHTFTDFSLSRNGTEYFKLAALLNPTHKHSLSRTSASFNWYSGSGRLEDFSSRIFNCWYLREAVQSNSLLKENMTLAVYVTLEKLANKVVEQQKKKK